MNEDQHTTKPRITVLTVPDCPNAQVARHRIADALNGRNVPVEWVAVSDEAGAAEWRMTGSPTVLVDGADPFAAPGARPSVSCRIYRHTDGTTDGAPAVAELREALTRAGLSAATGTDRPGPA
ncbi:hypothetical protein ACWGI0_11690 [Streptomyces sp. NPDC054802]